MATQPTRLLRTRINERLERAARFPVLLLVAPAGFGKSVALRDYLESSGIAAVRYNAKREDGTLLAFVRSFSEALAEVAPGALAAYPAMQERVLASEQPVRQLSDWFAEHLKHTRCTIAIDDLHFAAADQASIALIADVIERTSERISWMMAARSDVGLPVATWIAYGRMDMPIGEDELRFTTDEALTAADETRSDIDAEEVEALRQLTEGWPVALTIALRTRTHVQDLRTASFGTREMVYRYLAEQVFASLTQPQRRFALATSVLSTFDTGIAHALGADPQFLAALRSNIAFLNEISPGEYRYHDLFRDFLETELRRSGEQEWMQTVRNAAELLEKSGDSAGALLLYAKARASAPIVAIVERFGFDMFERGESETLASALLALDDDARSSNAAILGVNAMLQAGRGHFDLAERDYKAAIAVAQDKRLRVSIVLRYAIELVRHSRDCTALLEPYRDDDTIPNQERAPLLGTLATAYAREGQSDEAVRVIDEALDVLEAHSDERTRARIYQQAAYVFQFADRERTERYAALAVDISLRNNLYELAARAYSVLYAIRYKEDDPLGCLALLEKIDEYARKSASNQVRLFGLMASYEIEAERGNDVRLGEIEAELQEINPTFTLSRTQSLLPALAMRKAWSGDFAGAYRLRSEFGSGPASNERQALRLAETSLYAFASGASNEGEACFRDAATALEGIAKPTLRTTLARIFLALSELLRGHDAGAHRLLSDAENDAHWPRAKALAHAVRAMYRVQLGQAESQTLPAALERLRAAQFGGVARLIEALPASHGAEGAYTQLTPAEREILQMLANGAATKDIANRTGRSPHTVDTHIRAICRKLQCSGRREAVALAVSAGWVHA